MRSNKQLRTSTTYLFQKPLNTISVSTKISTCSAWVTKMMRKVKTTKTMKTKTTAKKKTPRNLKRAKVKEEMKLTVKPSKNAKTNDNLKFKTN
jgi:hypothetical protein